MKLKNYYPYRIMFGIMLFIPQILFAQRGYFEQGYGDGDSLLECGYAIYLNSNYDVAMVGYSERPGTAKDMTFILTDSLGEQKNVAHYGGSSDEVAYSMIRVSDGYLLAGYTQSYGSGGQDMYIVKINATGGVQWTQTVGSNNDEVAYSIIAVSNGFIVAGYQQTSLSEANIMVAKLDASGVVMWQQVYGGSGIQKGRDIVLDKSNHLIVVGSDYQVNAPYPSGFFLELDLSGNQINYTTVGDNVELEAVDVTSNKAILAVGNRLLGSNYNGYLVKLDSTNSVEFEENYGSADSLELFHDLKRIGGLIAIVGETRGLGEENADMWLVYADSLGDTVSTHTLGGKGNDRGFAMHYREGLIYCVGFNDSYGIYESGNIFQGREDLGTATILEVIGAGQDWAFTSRPLDCRVKRVLYVVDAFHASDLNVYGFQLCTWCNQSQYGNDANIDSAEFEDTALYQNGIIGNTIRENQLLAFIKKHSITEIYFYNVDKIFSKGNNNNGGPFETNYNKAFWVTNTGTPLPLTVVDYMKLRLNKFIIKAIGNGLQVAGFVTGPYSASNPKFQMLDNVTEYNNYVRDESFNYKYAGKVGGLALEHEFWNWGITTTDPNYSTAFSNHKAYLKKMLNIKAGNDNTLLVNDYIGYVHNNRDVANDPAIQENCTNTTLLDRAYELETVTDDFGKGLLVDRFFNVYYLNYCTDTGIQRGSLGARFQRDDWAYRTAIFGGRPNSRETQIFPLFGIGTSSIPAIGALDPGDDVAYWLGTRDGSKPTEVRKMKSIENIWMDDYPLNKYYTHCHNQPNKAFNGFVYFTYEQLQKVSAYNILQSQTLNFSNADSTPRISKAEYPTRITLPCYIQIPPAYKRNPLNGSREIFIEPESIVAYPNPSNGVLNVMLRDAQASEYEVFDVTGKSVLKGVVAECAENESIQIPVENLKRGFYILSLRPLGNYEITLKFVLQ